jgi:predicted RNA-binding protein
MCQAKVYIESGDGSKVVAEGVINLRVEGDTVHLSRFFEEPVVVRAVVKEADFSHRLPDTSGTPRSYPYWSFAMSSQKGETPVGN